MLPALRMACWASLKSQWEASSGGLRRDGDSHMEVCGGDCQRYATGGTVREREGGRGVSTVHRTLFQSFQGYLRWLSNPEE